MKRIIKLQEAEVQQRFSAYVSYLLYRFANICIKPDAVSLLPLEIEDRLTNTTLMFEQVAQAGVDEKMNAIVMLPFDQEFVIPLTKACVVSHPEWKLKYYRGSDGQEVSLDKMERNVNYFIRAFMPVVNQEMHDTMTETAKALAEDCATNLKKTYMEKLSTLQADMPECDALDVEDARGLIDDCYKMHVEKKDSVLEQKLREIDEAYQHYLATYVAPAQEEERRKEEIRQKVSSMKFDAEED